MKWKFIIVMVVALVLSGCSKGKPDTNNDLGSGDKSNLPVALTSLIEHAEYCKAIYDSGGDQKDEVAFEVKQDYETSAAAVFFRGTANTSNVQSDIDVRLVSDARTGILLHKGFRDASLGIMEIIDRDHTVEHTVHVTGHSLGGAVAQIIGMWLHIRGKMFKFSLTDHQKFLIKFCLVDNPLIGVWFAVVILSLLLLLGLTVIQDFL